MTLECNTQHTVSLFFLSWEEGGLVSFDSDYSGGDDASPFFSSGQFVSSLSLCVLGGVSGKGFVWTLAN